MSQAELHPTTCMICEAACGIVVEHEAGRVLSVRGDPLDPMSRGYVCPKVIAMRDLHEDPDRLRKPLIREGNGFREASFEEALSFAAKGLARVRRVHGKDALAIYQGNPTVHNLDLMTVGQLVLRSFGTKNLMSAASTDQSPHMMAAYEMFGHPVLMPVPDLDRTDFFLIIGANPLVSNGSLMTAPNMKGRLEALRARGGKLWVIDPRRSETAQVADQHLFVRPGSDAVLLASLVREIFAQGLERAARSGLEIAGLGALRHAVEPFTPSVAARHCLVPAEQIVALAKQLGTAERACIYGRVGICHQQHGSLAAWLVYALNLITGNLDREGGLMVPTGGIDILRVTRLLGMVGYDRHRSRVEGHAEAFGELPVATLASEIEVPGRGQVRALLVSAGNPLLSAPNGNRLEAALSRLEFMVSIDAFLNETSRHADVILPPVSQLERPHFDVALGGFSVRNQAKFAHPVLPKPEGALYDADILIELALRMRLAGGPLRDALGRAAAHALRRLGSPGLLDLLLRSGPHRLSLRELLRSPHGVDLGPLTPRLGKLVQTKDSKVQASTPRLLAELGRLRDGLERESGERDALHLIGRRQLRGHNSWLHNSRALIKGPARCTLMMSPADATRRQLRTGQLVRVDSRVGSLTATLEVSDDLMNGVVSLPHGFGHQRAGARLAVAAERPGVSANDLTDDRLLDHLTGNAAFSEVKVKVSAASEQV